jgi:LysR family transcriptional regulator, regulator of abg operon
MRFLYSRQLEHFLAACETLSLRGAAERCNVSQPALTKSIQRLEEVLSLTLFQRHANGVVPTPAAEIVRRHGRLIVDNCRHIEMEIAMLLGGQAGTLHIGSGNAWSVTRMPGLIAELHLRYPKLEITVEDGLGEQLVLRLLEGKLDVVVGRMPTEELPEGYSAVELPSAETAVFVRKGHPLSQRTVAVGELESWDFIGFTGDELGRSQREQYFRGLGLKPPRMILKSSALETMLTVVAKSDNLALLSDMFEQRAGIAGLQRVQLDRPLWGVDLGICFHRQSLELAPFRTLLELVRNAAAPEASP